MSDGPAGYLHLITESRPWYKNRRQSILCSTLCDLNGILGILALNFWVCVLSVG